MMRALVIDDSRAMRMILGRMLRGVGFEVYDAGNGQEALDQLAKIGTPELALVDWNMPVMDGLAFIKAVRAVPEHRGLRLMMVTTEAETTQMTRALEAGADEYVMKPFNRETILAKLALLGFDCAA